MIVVFVGLLVVGHSQEEPCQDDRVIERNLSTALQFGVTYLNVSSK